MVKVNRLVVGNMSNKALTLERIENILIETYGIVYNEDMDIFDIPSDLDVSEDEHKKIKQLITEFKKLL